MATGKSLLAAFKNCEMVSKYFRTVWKLSRFVILYTTIKASAHLKYLWGSLSSYNKNEILLTENDVLISPTRIMLRTGLEKARRSVSLVQKYSTYLRNIGPLSQKYRNVLDKKTQELLDLQAFFTTHYTLLVLTS
jgi:hypothetical protein